MILRPFRHEDFEAILQITIAAFEPIHRSFENILGDEIFKIVYPDWRTGYREYLRTLSQSEAGQNIVVADDGGIIVGFIMYEMNLEKKMGELGLNAVHPEHQNEGIGSAMYRHVLAAMEKQEIKLVEVATGGDASHAPARRVYEKCGFTALPLVRYYKAL